MEELKRKNPWLGLESYKEGEILYGRDEDIRDLSQSVLNDTDTLLYGKSGIGKSSILNAGIIPAARRHGFFPVLVRLSHKEKQTYLYQIKDAIANAMIPIPLDESGNQMALTAEEQQQRDAELKKRIVEVVDCKDAEKESLYEYFHRHTFHDAEGKRIKLLIIFDQFEEIFTLQTEESSKKRFFAELADFLNDVMPTSLQHEATPTAEPQKKITVIGAGNFGDLFNDLDLGAENNLPEYVTDNEIHMVFTIREDFLSEFEYYSASIPSLKQNRYGLRPINEEQAAQIILRPMPGLIDDSVAKLIIEKVTGRTDFELNGIPEIEVDSAVLSLYLNRLYDAKTGDKITSELVEEKGGEIIADFYNDAISSVSEPTIEYLEDMLLNGQGRRDNITVFDAIHDGGATEKDLDILCNKKKILRQFNYAGDLRIEYVHDILCPVVKAHKEERLLAKQQEEEKLHQEEEQKKILLKNRKKWIWTISLSVGAALIAALYFILVKMPVSNNYADFTSYHGWPKGIGPKLDDHDIKNMVVHYKLTRRGLLPVNPYFKVEVLNRHGHPATNILIESPVVSLAETDGVDELSRKFASMQLQVSSWEYTGDEEGNVSHQTAYSLDKKVLYSVQYYRESASKDSQSVQTLWMNYVDEEGKSLRLRGNGADRMRVTQRDGYITKCVFYNETGAPQRNGRKAFGYKYEVNPQEGYRIAIFPLNEYGETIQGQSLRFTKRDQYLRWTNTEKAHAEYGPDRIIYNMGNRNDSLLYDDDGHIIYRSEYISGHQMRTFSYDKNGNLKSKKVFDIESGKKNALVYSVACKYYNGSSDSLLERTEYTAIAAIKYRREIHQYKKDTHTTIYYCGNDISSMKEGNKEGEDYYKVVTKTTFTDSTRLSLTSFYGIDSEEKEIEISREENLYDKNSGLPRRKICYKDGKRTVSLEYEIEDNLLVGQHVVGIDGSIIRCPAWDDNHLCYYRQKYIRNFAGDIVAAKAINEFGEESLITNGDYEIQRSIVAGDEIQADGKDFTIFGIASHKYSAVRVNPNHQVNYLHITDTLGTYYQCGLRDGDILLSATTDEVEVARPLPKAKNPNAQTKYKLLSLYPQKGEEGAEHYPVFYTQKEMRYLKESLNKK